MFKKVYSLYSAFCTQPAFYSQSAVCILPTVCILPLVRSLRFTLTELTYLTNLNLAPSPTAGKPKLDRHTKED